MNSDRPSRIKTFVYIVLIVAVGTLLRRLLNPALGSNAPFLTLVPAVMLGNWLGGVGGGVAATVLSLLSYLEFIAPMFHRNSLPQDLLGACPFLFAALIISLIANWMLKSERRAILSAQQAEKAIEAGRLSEARNANILSAALDSIILIDENSIIVEFNPAAETTFGYSRDEVIGKPMPDCIMPIEAHDSHYRGIQEYLNTGQGPIIGKRIEVIAKRKNGQEFPIELTVVATRTAKGVEFTAYLRDISDRKRFEKDLLTSQERLRLTMSGAKIGLWRWDIVNDRLEWSETMYEISGQPDAKLTDFNSGLRMAYVDDVQLVRNVIDDSIKNRTDFDTEFRLVWPDGSVHWIVARGRAYYDESGEASQIEGIAVDITERKHAEQEAQAHADREALVSSIEQAWRSTLNSQQVQQIAVANLGAALGAERCFYIHFDIDNGLLSIANEYHAADLTPIAGPYNISAMFVQSVGFFADDQSLVVEDVRALPLPPELELFVQQLQVRAAIGVPLFNNGKLAAILAVTMTREPRSWTEFEVETVETVAAHTRLAIQSAQAQERERRIAYELQRALQPDLPSNIPGLEVTFQMLPALDEASIGGDFCDVFPLNNKQYALIIGDVSGKGLAAGAQLATVRNMLRCLLYEHQNIAEAANILNGIVTRNELLTGFVTIFAGIYSTATGQLQYVSCGHEPALIWRAKNGYVEFLDLGDMPLGVEDSTKYCRNVTTLNNGDTLLLYTDGLAESGPTRQELLGSEGIAEIFASVCDSSELPELASWLISSADANNNNGFRDDVCILVARRRA